MGRELYTAYSQVAQSLLVDCAMTHETNCCISVDELPQWSAWPARLLGQSQWEPRRRTLQLVTREYDIEKYGVWLKYWRDRETKPTPREIRLQEFINVAEPMCVWRNGGLRSSSISDAMAATQDLLVRTLKRHIGSAKSVLELGAGYGYNLWVLAQEFPSVSLHGGEYSNTGVSLGSALYSETSTRIKLSHFNFLDPKTYALIRDLPPPILLFTCHALEQLPSSQAFHDVVGQYRERIERVIHFEPLFQCFDASRLLGLLWRRYSHLNDYNRDLLSQLQARNNVRILRLDANVFGINPLNPMSVVEWTFV